MSLVKQEYFIPTFEYAVQQRLFCSCRSISRFSMMWMLKCLKVHFAEFLLLMVARLCLGSLKWADPKDWTLIKEPYVISLVNIPTWDGKLPCEQFLGSLHHYYLLQGLLFIESLLSFPVVILLYDGAKLSLVTFYVFVGVKKKLSVGFGWTFFHQ